MVLTLDTVRRAHGEQGLLRGLSFLRGRDRPAPLSFSSPLPLSLCPPSFNMADFPHPFADLLATVVAPFTRFLPLVRPFVAPLLLASRRSFRTFV